jgi:hypothetical protein
MDLFAYCVQCTSRLYGDVHPGMVPAGGREWQADIAEVADCLVPRVSVLRTDPDPP